MRRHRNFLGAVSLLAAIAGCQAIVGIDVMEEDPNRGQAGSGGQGTAGLAGQGGGSAGAIDAGKDGRTDSNVGGQGTGGTAGAAGIDGSAGSFVDATPESGDGGGLGNDSGDAAGSGGAGGTDASVDAFETGGAGGLDASQETETGGTPEADVEGGESGSGGTAGTTGDGGTVCAPNAAWCLGSTLRKCSASGTQITDTQCSGATPVCDAVGQECDQCLAGAATCEGSVLKVCSGDGQSWNQTQDCVVPALCNAVGKQCAVAGGVKSFGVGAFHACAILSNTNSLRCWGRNSSGQLGDGTLVHRSSGVPINVGAVNQVCGGRSHTCAVKTDKTVSCWGANTSGQLGPGIIGDQAVPTAVPGVADIVDIVCSNDVTCARNSVGTLKCWGGAGYAIGDGLTSLTSLAGSVYDTFLCGVRSDGSVIAWGGTGALQTAPTVSNAVETSCMNAATGPYLYVLNSAGFVYQWQVQGGCPLKLATNLTAHIISASAAYGPVGQLGNMGYAQRNDGTVQQVSFGGAGCISPSPGGNWAGVTDAAEVHVSPYLGCVRSSAGAVACVGDNTWNELGAGIETIVAAPLTVPGVSGVTSLDCGSKGSAVVIPDGSILTWGSTNALGATGGTAIQSSALLGTGNSFAHHSPNNVTGGYSAKPPGILTWSTNTTSSTTIRLGKSGFTDFIDARVGPGWDAGLRSNGQIVIWAETATANARGIFGDGTTQATPDTTAIVPGVNAVGIAPSRGTPGHLCAWFADGTVKCWGDNTLGQVGMGTIGLFAAAPMGVDFGAPHPFITALSSGTSHTCAVAQSGSVFCWGGNNSGQLGFTGAATGTPTEVVGIGNAVGVAAGPDHTCVWLADKTARCWGKNSFGQLGNSTFADSSAPVTVSGLTNVKSLSVGTTHSCALHHDGSVSCWGNQTLGVVGNGALTTYATPQPVVGLTQ